MIFAIRRFSLKFHKSIRDSEANNKTEDTDCDIQMHASMISKKDWRLRKSKMMKHCQGKK